MTQQNIKFSLDIGKIVIGLCTCVSVIFYAGKLDQKVESHEKQDEILHKGYAEKFNELDNKIFNLARTKNK